MALFETDDVRINYEISGDGPPVLLIAPGGLNSNISMWAMSPWNPIDQLHSDFTVIAMDQRNSGGSYGPISATHGWNDHMADQLGLLDHLNVDQAHFLGMCIGGPYIANIMKQAPERVLSAVLLQPVGIDNENRDDFWDISTPFTQNLAATTHPDVSAEAFESYIQNMWGGDFLLTATAEDVAAMQTQMLILMGDDNYHPEWTSRQMAELAPNAELLERWKDPSAVPQAHDAIMAFLTANS